MQNSLNFWGNSKNIIKAEKVGFWSLKVLNLRRNLNELNIKNQSNPKSAKIYLFEQKIWYVTTMTKIAAIVLFLS